MPGQKNNRFQSFDQLARLLDSKFRIPGTSIRFGIDPIIGIFPFLGDIISYIISAYLVWQMSRHGASGRLMVLMLINLVIDATVGSVPVLGTVFDVYYKANQRNVRLLKEYYREDKHKGSGIGIIAGILIISLSILLIALYLIWLLIEYLAQAIFTALL